MKIRYILYTLLVSLYTLGWLEYIHPKVLIIPIVMVLLYFWFKLNDSYMGVVFEDLFHYGIVSLGITGSICILYTYGILPFQGSYIYYEAIFYSLITVIFSLVVLMVIKLITQMI